MTLDDLARTAKHDLSVATRELPVIPIEKVRRRRLVALSVPAIGSAVVVLAIFFGLASLDDGPDHPVITTPTSTTTTTTTTVPSVPVRYAYDSEDLLPPTVGSWPTQMVAAASLGDQPSGLGLANGLGATGFTVLDDGRILVLDPPNDRVVVLGAGAETFLGTPGGLGSPRAIASSGLLVFIAFSDDAGGPTTVVATTTTGTMLGEASTPQDGSHLRIVGADVWLGTPRGPWTQLMTIDGTPIPDSSRQVSPSMPVADGSSILVDRSTITREYHDGGIVAWTIPAEWEITGIVDRDESLAVTVGLADGPLFQTVAAFELNRDGTVDPLTALGVIHTANRPPAQSSLFVEGSIYLLETGIDQVALYRATPPVPPATSVRLDPDVGGVIVGTYPESLVVQGREYRLAEPAPGQTPLALYSIESVAWVDGTDGLVYLDSLGQVHYLDSTGDAVAFNAPPTELFGIPQLVDVVAVDGRSLVAIMADAQLHWYDLLDRIEVDGPEPSPITHDEFGRILSLSAGGRTVTLIQPQYIYGGEGGGEPVGPFEPAILVAEDGDRRIEIEVGNEVEPWTVLHAFDGRRVVVSREPDEPAAAERTVLIIDLECPECGEALVLGPSSVDLIGVEASTGPIVDQQPIVCSAGTLGEVDVAVAAGLPSPVLDTARWLAGRLAACDLRTLEGLFRDPVLGALPESWRTIEQTANSFTAEVLLALAEPPQRIDDGRGARWVWPGDVFDNDERLGSTVRVEISETEPLDGGLRQVVWIGIEPT